MAEAPAIAYHERMSEPFTNKVALVTGGARGIGYAIVDALLGEGAKVFLCGRDPAAVKSSVSRLAAGGRADRVDGAAADVRTYQQCHSIVARAAERFGGLDILVNNAGIGIFKPVDQLSPEDWTATIETNLSAPFFCSREAIPLMRRRGGGYIFNISSLAAMLDQVVAWGEAMKNVRGRKFVPIAVDKEAIAKSS